MRILFTLSLLDMEQECTGTFAYRIVDLAFLPGIGMDVDGFGLDARKVLDVSLDLEGKKYDAYVKLKGIICQTDEDFLATMESLTSKGWQIQRMR